MCVSACAKTADANEEITDLGMLVYSRFVVGDGKLLRYAIRLC